MQILSRNLELRYFSKDAKATGETDFKGETSTLTTEQRIDFLNTYAQELPKLFDDFSLDNPIVPLTAAKERLESIKPQPSPRVRKRIALNDWKWIGYKQKNVFETILNDGRICIPTQNWRCLLEWELVNEIDYSNMVFAIGEAAVVGFNAQSKFYYVTNNQQVLINSVKPLKIKIELDFVYHKWNLYLNEQLQADFVDFAKQETNDAAYFDFPQVSGVNIIRSIWGVGYYRQDNNAFEPFRIETFIDENISAPVSIEEWNREGYDDSLWQRGSLPIVHGGERFAGQDIYLRKSVLIDAMPPYAELYLESLTPGGELYVNGRLAALIRNECCHKIDVTGYLKQGGNCFAVRVYADEIKPVDKMTHTHTDLHTGWFAGRMHLDLLPAVHLDDAFTWTSSITGDNAEQSINVSVKALRGMPSAEAVNHEINVRMMPWFPLDGGVCAETCWQTATHPNLAETTSGTLTLSAPKLWSAGTPNLYKIEIELRNPSGDIVDDMVITTGVRTVSQEGGIFRINGKPELLRAPLLFGARPPMDKIAAWDRCPPAEFYVQEMLMVLGMNGNGFRMSVHDKRVGGVNDPRICEIADQMGIMLVWQTTTWLRITSATNLDYDELVACIKQVRNHPSIVIWQPTNHPSWKNWDTVMRVYRKMHEAIMELDTSRLISPSADSRRMHPRWDDGLMDFEGKPCETCDPAWTMDRICRGNMDYMLGYGNEWAALRQWPNVEEKNLPAYMESTAYIPSYINSGSRAYFNFEHDEIIGQPNWNTHKGKPTYHVKSYEYYYDEGSIGRELGFEEWLTSQAWQAFGAYETICKCRWLDYDGLCWCNLRGGINTGTYQKSLVDYYGQPKLAYYAHRMVFQDVLACSENVDVVYSPDDSIPLIVLNIGDEKKVGVKVEIASAEDDSTVFTKEYANIYLQEGRNTTQIEDLLLPELPEGLYSIHYTVYQL